MKTGNRGLAKTTEQGKTVKMTVNVQCPTCQQVYAIKSDMPMKDQQECDACQMA